jgi:rSAM/selenodomain-associated transferase 1
MARVPTPGAVKTRLSAVIGAAAACRLYESFVGDLDERLVDAGYLTLWFHWPDEPGFHRHVPRAAVVMAQRGPDLGARMAAAFEAAFALGFHPVVMLGADVPHVPLAWVGDAAGRLAREADIVLGPARDGGYYLIGLGAPAAPLFEGVPWGTRDVYRETMRRVGVMGLRAFSLPEYFDIDEVADLPRLRALLRDEPGITLPRTRATLRALAGPEVPSDARHWPAARRGG